MAYFISFEPSMWINHFTYTENQAMICPCLENILLDFVIAFHHITIEESKMLEAIVTKQSYVYKGCQFTFM